MDLEATYHYLLQFLTEERIRKIEHFSKGSSEYILPVVEDVYQFRNAAAILRSVEACGFHKVVALEKENIFDPNLRVTKGADTWVNVEKMPREIASLQKVRDRGYKIVAVSPERNATMLPDYQPTEPLALVFGTEWEGTTDELLDFADETLAIPMYGFTQSFNVSVAAAICMYDLKQKLINSNIDYHLSEDALLETRINWAVNSIKSGPQILEQFLKQNSL